MGEDSKTDRKFFAVDDGGAEYVIVATDAEHAKKILRDHGVEFTKDDGDSAPIDDPAFADLEWAEMTDEAVSKIKVESEDGRGRIDLSSCPLGDFFCSEW